MNSDLVLFSNRTTWVMFSLQIMAYVDDLAIAGSSKLVKEIMSIFQEEFTLKHVNFLGRTIKRVKNSNIMKEFSQKFMDELLNLLKVTGKVTTTSLKLKPVPENPKAQCDKAIGKHLRMAEPKDDPNTMSRSCHARSSILKIRTSKIWLICSSLSFQAGISKGSFQFRLSAIQIQTGLVVKSQDSRKSTGDILVSIFNVNLQSTNRTQASIASSAEYTQ